MSDTPRRYIVTPYTLISVPGVPEDRSPRRGLFRETVEYAAAWARGRLRAGLDSIEAALPGPVLAPSPLPARRTASGR